jgi:mannose-6-phosphate isomerase
LLELVGEVTGAAFGDDPDDEHPVSAPPSKTTPASQRVIPTVTNRILTQRYRSRMEGPTRPWGRYEVLSDSPTFKVKTITVSPGKRLSYQRHAQRSEHWFVVHGSGKVTLDGTDREVRPGSAIDVPVGMCHRIENTGAADLVFVEVQHGDYFGEDDIERLDDDFGRVTAG